MKVPRTSEQSGGAPASDDVSSHEGHLHFDRIARVWRASRAADPAADLPDRQIHVAARRLA